MSSSLRVLLVGFAVTMTFACVTVRPSIARAHPLEFCALRISQSEAGFDVWLEYSGTESAPGGASVSAEGGCTLSSPAHTTSRAAGETVRARVRCARDSTGALHIEGLAPDVSVLATFTDPQGSTRTERGTGPNAQFSLEHRAAPDFLETAFDYVRLGLEHIAFGFDHLLFVLLLLFFHTDRGRIARTKRIALTITAFTLGHSLTLALATFGALSLPAAPVEAAIALSIVLLAAELARAERGGDRTGLTFARPWLAAALFGLLHGLGFAGALRDAGLPQAALGAALLGFNVGVELGQLAFVAAAIALLWMLERTPRARTLAPTWTAYAAGSLAFAWTLERAMQLTAP